MVSWVSLIEQSAQEDARKWKHEYECLKKNVDAMLREKEDAMEDALVKQRERYADIVRNA